MKKKYIIISIVSILVLIIGVSTSYFIANIKGEGKKISLKVGELSIIFTDTQEIEATNIDLNWSYSKEFTVENKSKDIYYYNIIIENLYNDFVTDNLKYKINSTDGYDMEDYEPVPKGTDEESVTLAEGIEINDSQTHTYTIKFKYFEDPVEDQSEDMEKHFSGKLNITKGEKPKTLAEQLYEKMKEQYPNTIDTKRDNFDTTITEASAYYEDGDFIENEIAGATNLQNKVYYYAGNVTNNWVSFAGYYWRIIRTNEDGSLRLLYGGPADELGKTTTGYITNRGGFNSRYDNPMYVGFKYGETNTLSNNRKNTNNSEILGGDESTNVSTLNGWYNANIKRKPDGVFYQYDDYISKTAIYCNDRAVPSSYYTSIGTFYYGAALRLTIESSSYGGVQSESNYHPSYRCGVKYDGNYIESTQAEEDKFSGMNDKANLKNPIGLMTADEVVYAGGKYDTSNDQTYYYLNANGLSITDSNWWYTVSPYNFYDAYSVRMFTVYGRGNPGLLSSSYIGGGGSTRPVISLKSCVQITGGSGVVNFTGNNEINNPYIVSIDDKCAKADN